MKKLKPNEGLFTWDKYTLDVIAISIDTICTGEWWLGQIWFILDWHIKRIIN